ncbi:MAG: hypothetical protein L0I24_13255 [Pseudonocardia sp.]|nr:hypothetical protein [Pseudonocardia sp.]
MPADLVPTVLGQLDILAAAPTVYLALVAIVSLAAVFSTQPGCRRAALSVLRLLLPRRRGSDRDDPPRAP